MATLKKQDPQDLDVLIIGETPSPHKPVLSHRNRYFELYRNRHEEQNIPPVANRPKPE